MHSHWLDQKHVIPCELLADQQLMLKRKEYLTRRRYNNKMFTLGFSRVLEFYLGADNKDNLYVQIARKAHDIFH